MRRRAVFGRIADRALALALAAVFLSPFYIGIIYSFKTKQEITFTGLAIPERINFGNYTAVLEDGSFFRGMLNSLYTTLPSVVLIMVICPMASYVFARNNGRIYNILYSLFLMAMLIPYQSVLLPSYANMREWGFLNTYTGNVLVKVGFQISLSILICTGFVKGIPRELEEAAYIDGLGYFGTFWRIVFPLMKSVLISILIINALFAWNDFQLSTVTLTKESVQTLPQLLYRYFGVHSVDLNEAFAAFNLAMLPLAVLYLLLQKYITDGVMAGSVKG